MKIESEKIILTEREQKLFDKVLESSEQMDDYFAEHGCDTCPLRLACKDYDNGDCAFANILHELRRIEKVIEVK